MQGYAVLLAIDPETIARWIETSCAEKLAGNASCFRTILACGTTALLAYLREQSTERLRTERVAVDPEFRQDGKVPDRIQGYVGRATVSFRSTPARLPDLLAGALAHGASSVDQSGSSPREEEVEAARTAPAQATSVAAAIGQRVVGVARLDVGGQLSGIVRPMMASSISMSARSAPIPVEGGDSEITVDVTLVARMEPQN